VLNERRMQRNRSRLEEDRERLMTELARLSAAMDDRERPGLSTHMADHGSEVFEQAKNLAVGERLRITLESVNRALKKMDEGTYAVCDRCGGPIDPARLKALPSATLCKPCQTLMEQGPRLR
jgi:DnaK suppressor protein